MANIGRWELNLVNNHFYLSDEVFSIFRIDKKLFDPSYDALRSYIHADDRIIVSENYQKSLKLKSHYSITYRIVISEGEIKYINETGFTEIDNSGNPVKSIGLVNDVTETKETEHNLLANLERDQILINAIPDMMFRISRGGTFLDYKAKSGEELFVSPEYFLNKNITDVLPPEVANLCMHELEKAFESKTLQRFEYQLTINNETYFYEARSEAIIEQNEAIFIVRDISEQKRSEEIINRLSLAIEQTADTIFITNNKGEIEYSNRSLESIYGYSKEELIGKNPRIFKSGIKDNDFYKILWDTILKGEEFRCEVINKGKDGTYVYEDRIITPVKNEDGIVTHFLSVGRDITQRKLSEIKQAKSERRFSQILQTAFDGFLIVGEKGNIKEVNEAYCEMSGYSRDELTKMYVSELEASETREQTTQHIKAVLEKGRDEFESIHKRKDETYFNVESSVMVSDFDGPCMIAFIKDITERKRNEEEILKLNRVLTVINQINQMIIHTKEKDQLYRNTCKIAVEYGKFKMAWIGLVDEVDLQVRPIVWYGAEDGYLTTIGNISSKDIPEGRGPTGIAIRSKKYFYCNDIASDPIMIPWREEAIKRGYNSSVSLPIIVYNKVVAAFTIYASEKTFFNQSELNMLEEVTGDISYAIEMLENNKKRELAEEKIKLLAYALESVSECVSITDINDILLFVNKSFLQTYGYMESEVIGKHIGILRPDEVPFENLKQILPKTIEGGWRGELINKRKDGSIIPILLSTSVIKNENEEPIALIGVAMDISEMKRSRDELIRAKEKAEEMNRVKDNFLANMSHELRTPLIGILGYAEIMRDSFDNTEVKEMTDVIYSSGQRLMRTLNMILDLSKIESNKEEIRIEEFDIVELARECLKLFEKWKISKNLELIFKALPERIEISSDKRMLDSILNNLLNNALKFTPRGSITVSIIEKNDEEKEKFVSIEVADTGIGISQESLNVIFDEFRQASEGMSRLHEGAGLGLTLTKKYIELLNGTLSVESVLGKGSTFTVEIPTNVNTISKDFVTEDYIVAKNNISNDDKRKLPVILLIDDDEVVYDVSRKFLSNKAKIEFASNFIEAHQKVSTIKYDLILLDINLAEEKNGIELLKEIKSLPDYKSVPVVACTAYAMDGDREKLLQEGFDEYISKPFNSRQLIKTIEIFFDRNNEVS